MKREIQPTPPSLVEQGQIHQGFFKEPFRTVNLLEADKMAGRFGKAKRWLRLKEWVGFGINHPDLFGGILVQNAKLAASGTVYLFDKRTKRLYDWLILDIPTRMQMPESLWNSTLHCGFGDEALVFTHEVERKRHGIRCTRRASKSLPRLDVNLVLHQDWSAVQPLVVSLPIEPDHHTYTHKSPLRLEGSITIGEDVFTFDPVRDLGNLDEQKTFYPYQTQWKWACFTARTQEGHELVTNFVNQMTPKDLPGEDAIWLDGRLILTEQPLFTRHGIDGAHQLLDDEGRISLHFTPAGAKTEKRNYGLIQMDYAQHVGRFDGSITDDTGHRHTIHGAFGALETMQARF